MNWEPLFLSGSSQPPCWIWFRPQAIPNGVIVVIPIGVFPVLGEALTIRRLIESSNLEITFLAGWSFSGFNFEIATGAASLLDQPIPPPADGSDATISIWMATQLMPTLSHSVYSVLSTQHTVFPQANHPNVYQTYFDELDSCWNSILQLEVKINSVRNQLEQAASRLNSLNRDLSLEERRRCDNKDKQDWQDARRWMRDSALHLNRSIKEIDMGITSGAGKRNKFDEIYRSHIAPRTPFPGIEQMMLEFESYRKSAQNVLSSAQATLTKSGRDAEQRANTVLQRITASSRFGRK